MSIERNESFNRPFQDQMLAHIVPHPRLLSLAAGGKFKKEDFDLPIHQSVFLAALEVVRIHGGNVNIPISEEILMQQLMNMVRLGAIYAAELQSLAELVANIYAAKLADDYYYGIAPEFTHHQRIHIALGEINKHTIGDLHSRLNQIKMDTRLSEAEPIMPLLDFTLDAPAFCVPTGISSLDSAMMGGQPLKEISMVCAYTGVGKTTFGTSIMWGGANLGFQTRFVTLELTGDKVKRRLYANIADYDYDKIMFGDGTGDHAAYQEIAREVAGRVQRNCQGRQNNLQVWDFSRERCSMQTLKDWAHRDQDRQAAAGLPPPQALYLDWLLLLDEDPGFDPRKLTEKEVRHKIQRHMNELSQFALDENLGLWVSTQGDQLAENKSLVTVKNAVEAKSSGWRVYMFGGLGMSKEDRQAKPPKAVFNASKTRDLRNFTIPLWAELDKQRFRDYPIAQDNDAAEQSCGPVISTLEANLEANRLHRGGVLLPPVASPTN